MYSSVPRMAHRCYHQWSTRASHVKRNAFGVLLRVKVESCNRCNAKRELNTLVCEAPNRDEMAAIPLISA